MGEVAFVMLVPITAILTTGTVLILRPITSRVGGLLEAMTQEKKQRIAATPAPDLAQVRDLLTAIDGRLSQIEERQDFAEALLSGAERRALTPPARNTGHN